jgi:hypothetical protein
LAIKIGISTGGLKLNLKRKNMTIGNLEKISKVFNVPMSYWWETEKNIVFEQEMEYEKTHRKTVDELTDTIAYFRKRCDELEKEKQKLKEDLLIIAWKKLISHIN